MSDEQEDKPTGLTRAPQGAIGAKRTGRQLARNAGRAPATANAPGSVELRPVEWPAIPKSAQMLIDWRRERRRKFLIRFGLICGLPTVLTFLYMALIASPRYVSETKITYQMYQPPTTLASGLVQTFLGGNAGSTVDLASILYEYTRSASLLAKLDDQLHLREYYSSDKVDFLSRMNPNAKLSTFLRYYLWYVSVSQDEGGYLTIDVQGFDPEFAQRLGQAIAAAADEMVDGMSAQARENEVRYAEDEVKKDEARVTKARLALTQFQNAHSDINPQGSANQFSGIVGQIETQLSQAQSSLTMLLSMTPQSPEVVSTKHKINALEQQLKQERDRLANTSGGASYSQLLNDYSALQFEEGFATAALNNAQQGVEIARADAARRQSYVIAFAPATKADKQSVELTLEYTITVLLTSVALFGIGSLMFGAMRDQAGF